MNKWNNHDNLQHLSYSLLWLELRCFKIQFLTVTIYRVINEINLFCCTNQSIFQISITMVNTHLCALHTAISFFFWLLLIRGHHSGSSISILFCPLHLPPSHQPPAYPSSPHPWSSSLVFLFSSCPVAPSSTLFYRQTPHPFSAHAQTILVLPLSLCLQTVLPVLSL